MKTLVVIILLALGGIANAQKFDAIYLSFQPANWGTGLRTDFDIVGTPVYLSFAYGSWGAYKKIGFTNNEKFTIGTFIPWGEFKGDHYKFNVGASYYWYDYTEKFYNIRPVMFWHWSVEAGITVYYKLPRYKFPEWFALSLTTDIPKWFPIIALGIAF